jgi:hypothetical protein
LSPYDPDKHIRVPCDARLWISALWLAAFLLIAFDLADRNASYVSVAALFLAFVAQGWTTAMLHAYSRRVILEVMSWEHRQAAATALTTTRGISP